MPKFHIEYSSRKLMEGRRQEIKLCLQYASTRRRRVVHEPSYVETGMSRIINNLRTALLAPDVGSFASIIGAIKAQFMEIAGDIVIEDFFIFFIRSCEDSDILLVALLHEYLIAHRRYRDLQTVDFLLQEREE
ncbi:hypothetical protein DL98DRAFT_540244 [Cadophora sp. DSE1049]|nr:hypothetical protein DL98DRAFT_540244 [Cadophora sp. DSE1049]